MSAYRQAEKDMIALNTPELHHNKGIVSKKKTEKPLKRPQKPQKGSQKDLTKKTGLRKTSDT